MLKGNSSYHSCAEGQGEQLVQMGAGGQKLPGRVTPQNKQTNPKEH